MIRRCRRTVALLCIAVLHVGWGLTVILDPRAVDRGDAVLYELLPSEVRLGLWLGLGAAVAVLALTRWQALGWGLAMLMPMERFLGHLWSWLMWLVPGAPPGTVLSAAYALRWAALATLIYLASGMTRDDQPGGPRG